MTTNKIIYEKEFFHFDTGKIVTSTNSRVINPRNNTSLRIEIMNGKTDLHKNLVSKYDLEIFPMANLQKLRIVSGKKTPPEQKNE